MNLGYLREFIVLAERLNFSEAARQLFIGQPVLSRHIADLEKQLGVQLFIRNRHSVQLTAVGELLLEESKALLARYEEALQKIRLAASGLTGSLKIGFLEAPVKKFLAPLAVHFNRVNPNIQLHLFSFDITGALNHALKHNEVDIGFTLSIDLTKGFSNGAGLNWQTLYSDVFSAVVRHDHPLAGKSIINLTDLAHEPLIMLARDQFPEGFNFTLELFESRGISPNIVKKTSRIDTVLLMVEMGLGIAVLPRHTQIYANPTVRFIDLAGDDSRFDVIIAWKKNNPNPAILPFIKEVETALFNKDASIP
ncbi:MAG: LysR family transcriptional regulator [Peptococcaceae bacterium]|nr:LysR family transcriptional regulator [Peptococcaceae bacterium]